MSLDSERMSELADLATAINLLTLSEVTLFNGYYGPDFRVFGCDSVPSTNVDVEQLASDCEGMTHEEIEYLNTQLNNEPQQHRHIGLKPGANPSGPGPSGNK